MALIEREHNQKIYKMGCAEVHHRFFLEKTLKTGLEIETGRKRLVKRKKGLRLVKMLSMEYTLSYYMTECTVQSCTIQQKKYLPDKQSLYGKDASSIEKIHWLAAPRNVSSLRLPIARRRLV
jgi:hypothetical protein